MHLHPPRKHSHKDKHMVLSTEELSTTSKNNLRGIIMGVDLYGDQLSYLHPLLVRIQTNMLNQC